MTTSVLGAVFIAMVLYSFPFGQDCEKLNCYQYETSPEIGRIGTPKQCCFSSNT